LLQLDAAEAEASGRSKLQNIKKMSKSRKKFENFFWLELASA
jgi:hypothetical protein